MPFITKDSLEALGSQIDLVELMSQYLEVRRVGANFMAPCPFHDDKTPSLSISQAKGLYYCHACGASGNAFRFIMEYKRLDFKEAVEDIASFFNVRLEYEQGKIQRKSQLLPTLASFYHNQLLHNQEVLDYLFARGLSMESIRAFELGYCGASFETQKAIEEHGLSYQEALECGVLVEGNSRAYARFSNRLIFPIHSRNGTVVGFGGRILDNRKDIAKYLNSPQSRIFNKSKILYGYHLAREFVYKQKSLVICEGYLDVILLHQAGLKNAVATLGTALNEGHLSLLHKDNPKIQLCYDGDEAGINAAFKASKLLAKHSKEGGVVLLSGGLDPADLVAQGRARELEATLKEAKPFIDFALEQIISPFDLKNPLQKQAALKATMEFMHTLSPLIQDDYNAYKLPAMLGVARHHLKRGRSKDSRNAKDSVGNAPVIPTYGIPEANLLFNMLASEENLFLATNFLEARHFQYHGEEFELIARGEREGDKISALCFKSDGQRFSLEDFTYYLRIFLLAYAKRRLAEIAKDSTLSSSEKIKAVGALRDAIERLGLKRELVAV